MISAEPTIPTGLQVLTAPDGSLVVRRSWRTPELIPLAVFAVIWNAFTYFWYADALASPDTPWPVIVLPLAPALVGVGLTYFLLASLVNHTDITASGAGVRVWSGPAPWLGNRLIPAGALWQVWVRARRGTKDRLSYDVMYAGPDQRERLLVVSTNRDDQAEYIAHAVRRTLRLPEPG